MLRALRFERAGHWPRDKARGTVTLVFDDRHRRRFALTSDAGESFLLDLPRAAVLDAGDGLALDDGGWIEVRPANEAVMDVHAADPELLCRLAWHIGNRHLAAEFRADRIRLRDDHVVAAMLEGLGAEVRRSFAPFTPERGAYDEPDPEHHHDHGHDHHHH
jgi:urease accessory protein